MCAELSRNYLDDLKTQLELPIVEAARSRAKNGHKK